MTTPRSAITIANHLTALGNAYDAGVYSADEYRAAVGDLVNVIQALDRAMFG